MDVSINYWAVLVAAAANMLIGSGWYGFVFGAKWRKMMGFTESSVRSMPLTPMQAMAGGIVSAVLFAGALAWLAGSLGYASSAEALRLAFWAWLGFAVPFSAGSWLWEGKSFGLFIFNAVYWLISFSAMSLIVTLWM